MQLQPFKRPDYSTIQRTRDQIAALRSAIADAYAWKDSMKQDDPATGPRVGDLHPWDALVDGCLYIDDEVKSGEQYAMARKGDVEWIMHEDDPDIDLVGEGRDNSKTRLRYTSAPQARVLAVDLKTADDFRTAIVAHRLGAAQDGGAK